MPKKRTKTTKKREIRKTARRATPTGALPPDITTPESGLYPIARVPERSQEDRMRDWFEYQFKQLRDRVDRLETSSVGEFATLLDSLRQQVRDIELNELARVAEINRLERSAIASVKSRIDDVVSATLGDYVSHSYLHTWVARINEQIDGLRALLEKETAR